MTEAQAERLIAAVERVAGLLDRATTPIDEPVAPGCTHPREDRIDFGVTHGRDDWECRRCHFRTVPQGVG